MFLTEKDLVNKLKFNYSVICNWDICLNNTKVLEEVDLGFGIADLVISKLDQYESIKNAFLNYFDITIYKIIESNPEISFDKIKYITKAGSTSLKKSLEKLMIECYIKETDALYTLSKTYKDFLLDSIAIEAKLKNWKRALNQAYRYKWFATSSYVILDEKSINRAILGIDSFKKMNVGLASINKNGDITIIYRPKKEKPVDIKMQMLLNEIVLEDYLDKRNDFQMAK